MNGASQERDYDPDVEGEGDDAVIASALNWSLVVFAVLILLGGAGYFYLRPRPQSVATAAQDLVLPETRKLPPLDIPAVRFSDVTDAAGIKFDHVSGAKGLKLLPETMGAGCAFLDADGDGDQDLLIINSSYWPMEHPPDKPEPTLAYYRNDGKGRFTDATKEVGLDVTMYGQGVAIGDYDNDGDVDVFVSALGENRLFRNDGGKFVDVTALAGVAGAKDEWSTSCAFIDIDNDDDLDLFVCNYVRWSREFDLAQAFTLNGKQRAYGPPRAFEGTFPYLYRNDGNGKFTDISAEAGVQVLSRDTKRPMAKSLGVAPIDVDGDGWIDIVVANDTVRNFLFHNLRNGTFREIGEEAGIAYDTQGNARGAMGIDFAFFRNDRCQGIAIGNFFNEQSALYVCKNIPMTFEDDALGTGFGPPTRLSLTFGLFFFDCDLDGRLDIFQANGHLEEEINIVQESQHYEQPAQIFWNAGPQYNSEFVLLSEEKCGSDIVRPVVGRGSAYADIDGDGDLDIVVTQTGRSARLFRNEQTLGHHWVRLRLVGTKSNRSAIGAMVELHTEDGEVLRQQVMPSKSYLSQSELPVTFGLGTRDKVKKVVIRWPAGEIQEIGDIAIDSLTVVTQPIDNAQASK